MRIKKNFFLIDKNPLKVKVDTWCIVYKCTKALTYNKYTVNLYCLCRLFLYTEQYREICSLYMWTLLLFMIYPFHKEEIVKYCEIKKKKQRQEILRLFSFADRVGAWRSFVVFVFVICAEICSPRSSRGIYDSRSLHSIIGLWYLYISM